MKIYFLIPLFILSSKLTCMENSTPQQSETERDRIVQTEHDKVVQKAKEGLEKIKTERQKKDAMERIYYHGNPY